MVICGADSATLNVSIAGLRCKSCTEDITSSLEQKRELGSNVRTEEEAASEVTQAFKRSISPRRVHWYYSLRRS